MRKGALDDKKRRTKRMTKWLVDPENYGTGMAPYMVGDVGDEILP